MDFNLSVLANRLFPALVALLNVTLRENVHVKHRLHDYANKQFKLTIVPLGDLSLPLRIREDGELEWVSERDAIYDLELFMTQLPGVGDMAQDPAAGIMSGLLVEGSVELADVLSSAFKQMQFSLADRLQPYLGDILTARLEKVQGFAKTCLVSSGLPDALLQAATKIPGLLAR